REARVFRGNLRVLVGLVGLVLLALFSFVGFVGVLRVLVLIETAFHVLLRRGLHLQIVGKRLAFDSGGLLVDLLLARRLLVRGGRTGCAKGRNFDDLAPEDHVRQSKAPPDQAAIAKQRAHLVRQGIGRDVKV